MKNSIPVFISLVLITVMMYSCSNHKKRDAIQENIIQNADIDSSRVFKGVFDLSELTISRSPDSTRTIFVNTGEKMVDYDVSPAGPVVAALIKDGSGNYSIKFWQISQKKFSDSCAIFNGFTVTTIAWHPRASALFVIGIKDNTYHILKVEKDEKGWTAKSIFSSTNQLRRLVVCPRPFIVGYNDSLKEEYFAYRIFFGMANDDNSFRITTITETGSRFYQVVGLEKSISHFDEEDTPSVMKASYALPIAFHPDGNELLWEDKNHNFFVADYDNRVWGNSAPLAKGISNDGTITPTPNGMGLLHWQKDKPGIGLYIMNSRKEDRQIPEYQFTSTPSSVPDGKGIVGLTEANGRDALNYVPINVPLADVANAWMYSTSQEEMSLFQKNYGLFRPNTGDQLYKLYETENYYCGDYDMSTPTRPYMVTTDIFWELFGAAYQGLFITKERENAIPGFWQFIDKANNYFATAKNTSSWAPVFKALSDLNSDNKNNPEVERMYAQQSVYTDIQKDNFDYSELKPRGHYAADSEMQKYFMAFKYFTTIYTDKPELLKELNTLPNDIKGIAVKWIESYMGLISSPRSPLVWSNIKYNRPSYNEYPGEDPTLFPLSWGIDNEVIYSTIYHEKFPLDKQIIGKDGPRMLPSGLDLASVLGDGFAESLLQSDYDKYPNLRKVINHLKENFRKNSSNNTTLYDKWMNALAVQWVDTVMSPNGNTDKNIFNVKRLQTGLASWTTLRHTTILVNERDAAECGEGGFEEIVLSAPRGYVEPDPYTFSAIAGLFDAAISYVPESVKEKTNGMEDNEKGSLYDGIIKRLKETAKDARMFQAMAEKEKRGEPLTNEEYERILYVGRDAEHYFLIFESLTNKDYGLATPDPIAKIADVSGDQGNYLMAAVGNAMEWDNIVPFWGRHEIVKGSIYSYYEFPSEQLLNDKEWQEKVSTQEYPSWIKPYITKQSVNYPAITGY